MTALAKSGVNRIYNYMTHNYEVCGALIPFPNSKNLVDAAYVERGPDIEPGVRASCNLPSSLVNWHTHPRVTGTLPWPSTEDIFKVLSGPEVVNGKVLYSANTVGTLIFTDWGVWEISSKYKFPVEKFTRLLVDKFNRLSDEFYNNVIVDGRILTASEADIHIELFINDWEVEFEDQELEIILTPFNTIVGDYKFKTKIIKNIPNKYFT